MCKVIYNLLGYNVPVYNVSGYNVSSYNESSNLRQALCKAQND